MNGVGNSCPQTNKKNPPKIGYGTWEMDLVTVRVHSHLHSGDSTMVWGCILPSVGDHVKIGGIMYCQIFIHLESIWTSTLRLRLTKCAVILTENKTKVEWPSGRLENYSWRPLKQMIIKLVCSGYVGEKKEVILTFKLNRIAQTVFALNAVLPCTRFDKSMRMSRI